MRKNMKDVIKFLMLVCLTAALAGSLQAQTPINLVIEKMHEDQWVEYSLNPGETKEIAVIEVKIPGMLSVNSSLQARFSAFTTSDKVSKIPTGLMGTTGRFTSTPYRGPIDTATTHIPACGSCRVDNFGEMTTWTLKSNGNTVSGGTDEIDRTYFGGENIINFKFKGNGNRAGDIAPGKYIISLKCETDTPCKSWLNFYLSNMAAPDPSNLGP